MSLVVGLQNSTFTTKDGKEISGTRIFLTEKIPADRGQGVSVDSIFLSKEKADAMALNLAVGDDIEVFYNKYGRVQEVRKSDEVEF